VATSSGWSPGRGAASASRITCSPAALPPPATAAEALARFRASVEKTRAAHRAAGGRFCTLCSAAIDAGWHVYSLTQGAGGPIAMRITLAPSQPFALEGIPTGPAPHKAFDPNFGIQVELYEKSATFAVPVAATADAQAGKDSILVRPRYQACNASLCLPPRTETVAVPVTVATSGKKSAPTS